jgi:hypothetical protein
MRQATPEQEAGARGPRSRPRGRTHAGRTRRPARCHWRRLAAPPGGAGEGSRGARRREGGRERQRARGEALSAERGGKHWAAASTGRRQALGGGTRNTAPGAGHAPAHAAATRRDRPCGAGAPAAGSEWPGRPASPRFPTRATAPATAARGFAGEATTSPFDLVSIPAAWTPSTRPFDRDTGPSGDTARVTQSAAVCRHFPARASACHPNSRLCPTLTGAAIRRSA